LLVEEQTTNILRYTEDLTNAAWEKLSGGGGSIPVVTAASGISPAGINNAFKVEFTAPVSGDQSRLRQGSFATSAGDYAGSLYIKAFSAADVGKVIGFRHVGGGAYGLFTLTADWQRITKTETRSSSNFEIILRPAVGTSSGSVSLLYYGGQLEAGASATSYIPNLAASTTTRNADVATITGTNFSDWWQASRGGVLVRARPGTVSNTRPWVQFDDGTVNEIIALRGNTTNPELYIVDGGTPQAQIDAGTIAADTDYSLTAWWATNDCKARLNNGAVVTDTTATIPTVTQARLGSDGTNYLNGHLASINYYDTFSGQIYTRRKNKAVFSLL